MTREENNIDWSLTTWEGSHRELLRRWMKLTVRERFEALEQMTRTAELLQRAREEGRLREPQEEEYRAPKHGGSRSGNSA